MRRLLQILSLLSLSLFSFAGEKDDDNRIRRVVNTWNDAHNKKQFGSLNYLYDTSVLYYGKNKTREYCVKDKYKIRKYKSFRQEIISGIQINRYSSGVIKCSFVKQVVISKKTEEYSAYLLLEKRGIEYLIVGESDLISDEKLGFILSLGYEVHYSEVDSNNNHYILITLGLVFFLFLLVISLRKRRRRSYNSEVQLEKTWSTSNEQNHTGYENKGLDFESYVASKFDRRFFTLVEWRGDKSIDGRFAMSSMLPDLEITLNTKGAKVEFAVECKWRKGFGRDGAVFIKPNCLQRYREFQQQKSKFVFLIIGVGGVPSEPAEVYIVPLNEVSSNVLYASWLTKYKRHKRGNFFLHHETMNIE